MGEIGINSIENNPVHHNRVVLTFPSVNPYKKKYCCINHGDKKFFFNLSYLALHINTYIMGQNPYNFF